MRRLLLTPLLAAFLSPALAEDTPKAPVKSPRLVVAPASFDFGKEGQNKTLQTEFSLKNVGSADLVIENVSTTCGCTAALLTDKVIKPGSASPLRVSLETRTYSGRVERTVLIRSNDPATTTAEVKVSVLVVPPEK